MASQSRAARLTPSRVARSPKSSVSQPSSRPHCRSSASCVGSIVDSRVSSPVFESRVDPRVDRKQPFLDQEVDQRRGLRRNVGAAGDVASGRLAVGVDAGEPGDQSASQQGEARLTIAGNARIGIRAHKGPLDRRIDRAFDPAELFVIDEPQRAGLAIVEIELLEREGEQRQRVARARLDVDEEAFSQRRFDRQFAASLLHPSRRALRSRPYRRPAASAAARTQPAAGLRALWRFGARRRNRSGW